MVEVVSELQVGTPPVDRGVPPERVVADVPGVVAPLDDRKPEVQGIVEQRRGRRWGIFFKLLGFVYLAIVLVFSIGNSSDAFLLIRAREFGVPASMIPLFWAGLHAVMQYDTRIRAAGGSVSRTPPTSSTCRSLERRSRSSRIQ